MRDINHFIGGASFAGASGRFSDVFNPSTGEVQARVQLADPAQLDLGPVLTDAENVGRAARVRPARLGRAVLQVGARHGSEDFQLRKTASLVEMITSTQNPLTLLLAILGLTGFALGAVLTVTGPFEMGVIVMGLGLVFQVISLVRIKRAKKKESSDARG